MRKILFVLLLISTPVYAGSITINYPDGEQNRIVNGITKDGAACTVGETLSACAKRLITNFMKHEVKTWDDIKNKKQAVDALTPAVDPNLS